MKVKVLYFSSIKDKIKRRSEEIDIKEGLSVGEFIQILKDIHPEISDSLDNVMIAVNEEYVDNSYILKEKDIIALIPPVSGG